MRCDRRRNRSRLARSSRPGTQTSGTRSRRTRSASTRASTRSVLHANGAIDFTLRASASRTSQPTSASWSRTHTAPLIISMQPRTSSSMPTVNASRARPSWSAGIAPSRRAPCSSSAHQLARRVPQSIPRYCMSSSSRRSGCRNSAESPARGGPNRARAAFMTVIGLDREHRHDADQRRVVGEDPDDVGAPRDLTVEALKRVRRSDLGPVLGREGVEGEHVGLGLFEQRGDLRQPALELLDGVAQPPAGLIAVGGGEDLADDRAERVVLVAAHVAAQVSEEVHGAALPRRAEDLRERRLQSRVRVGDGELDADQPARDERAQELAPERLGLGLTDVQADDLASAGLVDGVRDHDRLARDAAAVADLLDLRVDEQIRVAALQRPLAKRLDLLVEQPRDPTALALADAQPEPLDELIAPPRRHAADIGLLDDRDERLLGALARLQEAREVAALTDLRDLQLDLPGPRVPPPRPIAVAMRRPILGPLAVSRADQLGDLGLHQLLRHHAHRLADHVTVLLAQHLPDDLLDRHPVPTGHCRPPFVEP